MLVGREEKQSEAIERLNRLNAASDVVDGFKKGVIKLSENGECLLISEEQKKMIKLFEKKHNTLVYHVIRQNTKFGQMYNLLYVSDCKSDWDSERDDIDDGILMAYVVNTVNPDCSEFGSIGVKSGLNGLLRVW